MNFKKVDKRFVISIEVVVNYSHAKTRYKTFQAKHINIT